MMPDENLIKNLKQTQISFTGVFSKISYIATITLESEQDFIDNGQFLTKVKEYAEADAKADGNLTFKTPKNKTIGFYEALKKSPHILRDDIEKVFNDFLSSYQPENISAFRSNPASFIEPAVKDKIENIISGSSYNLVNISIDATYKLSEIDTTIQPETDAELETSSIDNSYIDMNAHLASSNIDTNQAIKVEPIIDTHIPVTPEVIIETPEITEPKLQIEATEVPELESLTNEDNIIEQETPIKINEVTESESVVAPIEDLPSIQIVNDNIPLKEAELEEEQIESQPPEPNIMELAEYARARKQQRKKDIISISVASLIGLILIAASIYCSFFS